MDVVHEWNVYSETVLAHFILLLSVPNCPLSSVFEHLPCLYHLYHSCFYSVILQRCLLVSSLLTLSATYFYSPCSKISLKSCPFFSS
jgi:hypothetical protein